VALANLDLIEDLDLVTRVRDETGPYLASALAKLADHPLVGEVRSYGLLGAIELVQSKDGPTMFEDVGKAGALCRDHAIAHGMMMRAVRDGMIMSPPLTFTLKDIDKMIDITTLALDKTAHDLGIS
jgi:putrescine aminotransferase